jgi:hypothetical protein
MLHRQISILLIFALILLSDMTFAQPAVMDTVSRVAPVKSEIAIPVKINIRDVEKIINSSVTGLLYEDNSYTDNDNDQFKIKVWKRDNIYLTPNSPIQFIISVPLKVWAEKGYGALGYYTYKDCSFDMILKFKTTFKVMPDWTIRTVTTPAGYTWINKPVLKFGLVDIPITPIVESILDKHHASFSKVIDDKIRQYLNLKPYGIQSWNSMKDPYLISDEYKSWLLVQPLALKLTPLNLVNNFFTTTLSIDINAETVTGCMPPGRPAVKDVPNLVFSNTLDPEFKVFTTSLIDYGYATELAKTNFDGYAMEFLGGKYTIYLNDIEVGQQDSLLLIHSRLSGKVDGNITLSGKLYYDEKTQEVGIQNTQFDLKTKNIFQRSAGWLFNGLIEKNIEKKFKIPAKPIIDASLAGLTAAINKEYYKGVKMNGKVTEFKPVQILPAPEGIRIIVYSAGTVSLDVQGL